MCDDGTQNHQWESRDVYCDDCGDHPGFSCLVCWETVDGVFQSDDYTRIEEQLSR